MASSQHSEPIKRAPRWDVTPTRAIIADSDVPMPTELGRVGDVPLPYRVVIGANGAYWRDFGAYFSMCPVSSDNDPVEEVAVYVPIQVEDRLRAERDAVTEALLKHKARVSELEEQLETRELDFAVLLVWLHRDPHEPWETDISDFSDEWCAGFFAGQENAQDVLDRAIGNTPAASSPAKERP